ncbi:RecBCD enzyme subunit RecC [Buchnera aphidicola (Eriosoma grossulariae)]|uniref:exodeoxyribonuclease V subunit gamma n=1 Tax=Buchnera aphidicola TaxID=9 RepID=UPI00346475A3
MLIIYKSNQFKKLLNKVCQIIQKEPLKNPLQNELFIVNNKETEKWMKILIAKKISICSNIQFYQHEAFIWKIIHRLLPEDYQKYNFHRDMIFWKILSIIQKYNNKFIFDTKIKNKKIQKFNFAYYMSYLFHQYLIYRPEWINCWDKNININISSKSQLWQKKLWTMILKYNHKINQNNNHFYYIKKKIIDIFNHKKNIIKNFLPMRIFIFNTSNIPHNYIKIINSMSKIYKIYILLNINHNYNINYQKKIKNENNLFLYEKKYIFNHIQYLYSMNHKTYNLFSKIKKNNLLQKIQKKILCNQYNNTIKKKYIHPKIDTFLSTDNSISIHICHSLKREIEILHNNLLNILQKNKIIHPQDIIVLSIDINIYVPFIHAIFNSAPKNYFIPFTIANSCISKKNTIFYTFEKLLNIANSIFENEEILSYLSLPILLEQFKINLEELKILKKWIKNTNIKIGFDKQHLNQILNINTNYNSWNFGIDRMLLNYAINNKKFIWKNTVPYNEINYERSELISKLNQFIILLNKWRKILSIPKTLKKWLPLLSEIIEDFFPIKYLQNKEILFLKKIWNNIISNGLKSHFEKKITITILQSMIANQLNKKENYSNLFSGKVNFCNINLLENIPFQVIYLIGINEDVYPRKIDSISFNLIKKFPKIGDKNHRLYDHYIFLNYLLNAQKYFYISCINLKQQNINNISSSILIEQLINCVTNHFQLIDQNYITNQYFNKINDNKKKIINHLYHFDNIPYGEQDNFKKQHFNQNFKNQNCNITYIQKQTEKKTDQKLFIIKSNKIDIINFIQFWKNPIKFLFFNLLKIKTKIINKKECNIDYFSINSKNIYCIKQKLLDYLVYNKNIKTLYEFYKKSGILPYGNFGQYIWDQIKKEMIEIYKMIFKLRNQPEKKIINIKINQYQLYNYELKEIHKIGLIRWKPHVINIQDKMSLWIEHLIYCFLNGEGNSYIFGNKKSNWVYSNLSSKKAFDYLEKYIKGYLIGINQPLMLTQSGFEWIKSQYDKKNKIIFNNETKNKMSKKKFFNEWNGNINKNGEKDNIFIRKIITEINKNDFINLCNIAKQWFLPILKNQL